MLQGYMLYIELLIALIILFVVLKLLYSPSQWEELKTLYKEQKAADDAVYEWKEHAGPLDNLLFKYTTKDSGHYYE